MVFKKNCATSMPIILLQMQFVILNGRKNILFYQYVWNKIEHPE
jgi:hypothetical protein